jgi:segregation and condensation protein B
MLLHQIITLLYLSGEPMKADALSRHLSVPKEDIEGALGEVSASLQSVGLSLLDAPDGLSIVTTPEQAKLVESFWKEELQGELTPATLQVITLVAYLGAPTREEISYVRGVQSAQSIRTLTVRGLISRHGEVCTLTSDALKQLGVTRAEDLPEYGKIHAQLLEKLTSRAA